MANCPHCSGDHDWDKVPMKKMGKNWYCPGCGQEFKKKDGNWRKV
jgi:transposase-like protein